LISVSSLASMLREHGAQRPSVFELLSIVHGLRGSKSLFLYPIPSAPLLSPKHAQQPPLISPSNARPQQHPNNAVTSSPSNNNPNAGVQAREKVLEAIAPMRRGRPSSSKESKSRSRPTSPQKLSDSSKALGQKTDTGSSPSWLEEGFDAKARATVTTKDSAGGTGTGGKNLNDAWVVKGAESTSGQVGQSSKAFDDDFGKKLWDSFDPVISSQGTNTSAPNLSIPKYRPSVSIGNEATRRTMTAIPKIKTKDAFGDLGLNLAKQPTAPTLGEARKLRTGLAILSTTTPQGHNYDNTADLNKSGTSSTRPTPSPRPSYLSPSPSQFQSSSKSHSPSPSSPSAWKLPSQIPSSRPSPSLQLDGLPVESRFPSLEELDASFTKEPSPHISGEQQLPAQDKFLQPPPLPSRSKLATTGPGTLPRPVIQRQSSYSRDHGGSGVRSEQVTGVAMRESSVNQNMEEPPNNAVQGTSRETSRPALRRKHRSTVSMTQAPQPGPDSGSHLEPQASTVSASRSSPQHEPRDWLTGDDDGYSPHAPLGTSTLALIETSVRDLPSKRSSFVESGLTQPPHENAPKQTKDTLTFSPMSPSEPSGVNTKTTTAAPPTPRTSRILPPSVKNAAQHHVPRSSNDDWRPVTVSGQDAAARAIESKAIKPLAHKDRSRHVKEPPIATPTIAKDLGKESSSDEGPEDVNGYVPPSKAIQGKKQEQAKKSHKGRQSSVHELVDLWGGAAVIPSSNTGSGSNIDASTKGHRRRPTTAGLPLPPTQPSPASTPRSASPLHSAPADSRPSKPSRLPIPEPEQHSRQLSASALARSPVTSRSRPQSMFLFPVSKSTSDGAPPSADLSNSVAVPGLSTSDVSRRSAGVRRTSISDMVQLYEAIGGKAKPLEPPIVLSKPVSKTSLHQESNSFLKAPLGTNSGSSTGDDILNSRSSPNESNISRESTTIRSSPTRSINNPALRTSPVGPRDIGRSKKTESSMPPKTRPYKASGTSDEITLESLDARFPSRKSTTSTEESTKPGDERSSSPERPYQGVGKLIAQWQRKTEEADPSRNPANLRRGGVPKRPLVSGGDRGR
jgi:AP2-associated kinase